MKPATERKTFWNIHTIQVGESRFYENPDIKHAVFNFARARNNSLKNPIDFQYKFSCKRHKPEGAQDFGMMVTRIS